MLFLDNVQGVENNFDPFTSTAKERKIDFFRKCVTRRSLSVWRYLCSSSRKAQELLGPEGFDRVYNYLHDQRREQARDPTRSDDVILSGLETLSSNGYARTLINELVLYECLNELNERSETS